MSDLKIKRSLTLKDKLKTKSTCSDDESNFSKPIKIGNFERKSTLLNNDQDRNFNGFEKKFNGFMSYEKSNKKEVFLNIFQLKNFLIFRAFY